GRCRHRRPTRASYLWTWPALALPDFWSPGGGGNRSSWVCYLLCLHSIRTPKAQARTNLGRKCGVGKEEAGSIAPATPINPVDWSGSRADNWVPRGQIVSATWVVGLQWGDEAKGKIVDLLTDEHDIVVRYQGGNNAGHTVVFNGDTYKLSLLPAGILHPKVVSVIATGIVLDPRAFLQELDSIIKRRGPLVPGSLLISDRAHVIFPYHMLEEAVMEKSRVKDPLGTTMRGIGPCYRDKAGRAHAIRVGDLCRPEFLRSRLTEIVAQKNTILGALDPEFKPLDAAAIYQEYSAYADRLRPYVTDTTTYLHQALRERKRILFEG